MAALGTFPALTDLFRMNTDIRVVYAPENPSEELKNSEVGEDATHDPGWGTSSTSSRVG